MTNKLLGGKCIVPMYAGEAKKLIGKRVQYLQKRDIDQSGRGYFFPRTGDVVQAIGRNIEIGGSWISLADLVEMREVSE